MCNWRMGFRVDHSLLNAGVSDLSLSKRKGLRRDVGDWFFFIIMENEIENLNCHWEMSDLVGYFRMFIVLSLICYDVSEYET